MTATPAPAPTASEAHLRARLLIFAKPYWRVAALALVTMLTFALVDTALVSVLRRAVDEALAPIGAFRDLTPARRYDRLLGLAEVYGSLALAAFGLRYGQMYVLTQLGQLVVRDLRRALFAKFQRLPLAYFDRNPVGRLMTRVTSDVDAIQQFLTQGLVGLAQDALLLLVFATAMLVYDWRLALVAFGALPVMVLVTSWLRGHMRTAFRETRTRQAIVNANLAENISGMSTVQLFGREARHRHDFGLLNASLLSANLDTIKWYSLFYPTVALIAELGLALTLWYGGLRTLEGAVTIGTLVAMMELLRRLLVPLQDLADKFNILQAAMASAERIFEVLDEPETLPDSPRPRPLRHLAGRVDFEDVWFSYHPSGQDVPDDAWVLRELDLHIQPGESVALVGATGAGKTSVISLVSRFYDVQRGTVKVDGVDVRDYAQRDLRRHVGVVLQDVFLFTGTILSNLTLGDERLSRDRVIEVCRFVGAHDFIVELANGYDTPVQERGATLSTGQKQLLAFARALLQNPDVILVLDEATANIDTETEQRLQEALEKLMMGRTSIIIAHRLSTIEHVDRIVVMRAGRVVEQGRHAELLARNGEYARLHADQRRRVEEA
ncbi:ABC transporter ATP-binding protein [Deinococcus yavapaiensis]|uniref:ATP-binding cassette subfamily B protein n=1 Tax=Deinococcus yavapaiensis KR-236 TaxID=694435 RepID=A0A318RZT0_9DEIO|nr:ABC transporter ATP-binding protein [Deinococcus yavapaiensis]PYE49914.1 ATP-binding cassette subfamily B protein [Deinococcus yavapaiensis KR-236]